MTKLRPENLAVRRVRSYWILGLGLMVIYAFLRGGDWQGNSQLHTIMETAATFLALVVGAMALVRYASKKNTTFLFVGTGFLGTAMLDGYHAIVTSSFFASYLPSELSSLIPWSWVASRLFLSTMLCLSWFAWLRGQRDGGWSWSNERTVYVVGGLLTLASFLFFAFVPLPRAYYPEFVFHRPEEFVPAAFFAIALVGYWRKGLWRKDDFEHYIMLSLVIGFVSQAAIMSLSAGLFDADFDLAHLLKVTSYVIVLFGLFKNMSSTFRQAEDRAEHLRGIVNTAQDGIIALDDRGVVTSFNPAAAYMFGYQEGEVVGQNVSLLMAGKDHDDHDSYLRNYLETGEKKIIGIGREVEGRRKDGTIFPLDLGISEMLVSGNRAFTGIVRDITDRKHAEETAEKQSAQLALIKSVAVDANEIDDVDEFIRSCVDHICDFTGWPVGHVYQIKSDTDRVLHSAAIWHLDDPERFEKFRKITEKTSFAPGVGLPGRVMESGKPEQIVDVTRDPSCPRAQQVGDIGVRGAFAFPVNLDGECVMVLEFYSSVAEQIDRDLMDVLASTAEQIGRRIEREQAAQALRVAQKESQQAEISAIEATVRAESANLAKSDFLDNMSHELRTPLNGMLGFSDMIEQETLGPLGHEQYAEYVKIIGNSGRHLLGVINDVLDYSKIESGKITLDPTAFDLSQAIEGVVEVLSSSAHEKRIDIGCFVEPDVPTALIGDQARLRQILLNLMGNAIKFTETGGVKLEVSMEAGQTGETCLRFEVSDTGIGIEEPVQAKLFQKFSQGDASTTRKYGGSGLGLAISRHLVTLMGGEIGLVSEVGAGSLFWFTAVLRTREDVREDAMAKVAACLQGRRALVVDDNHVNRLICRQNLDALGATVIEASDGEEALAALAEAAKTKPIELAIIDHMMAGVDGVELGLMIREKGEYDGLKMVLSSSSGQVVSHKNARDMGFDAALPKPLHRTAVLNCLAGLYGVDISATSAEKTKGPSETTPNGPSLYCLMAEDNNVNQLLLQTMLSEAGHRVDIAKNGCEAVEAAKKNSYDVIFMDVHMPVMNGLEATRQIRQIPGPMAQVPILAVTAAAMTKDKDKCFLAGMNDFISKPIDMAQLFQKMAFWTGTDDVSLAGVPNGTGKSVSDEVGDDAAHALDDFLGSIDDGSDAKQA